MNIPELPLPLWVQDLQRRRALGKQKTELHATYPPLIKKAQHKEEKECIGEDYASELWEIDENLRRLDDARLLRKARRLYVPIPPKKNSDMWEDHSEFDYYLTSNGIVYLNEQITKKKRERLEIVLKVIQALTGLIGVLIGLAAILLSQ